MKLQTVGHLAAALVLAAISVGQVPAQAWRQPDANQQPFRFEVAVPRFAVVIHTNTYDDAQLETTSVANAQRDADRIAKVFRTAEFDPVIVRNATRAEILATIASVVDRQIRVENLKGLRPVLAVYFSGHGFSAGGQDYITGRDFRKSANVQTGVAITAIIDAVSSSADLLVFNDACRTQLAPSPQAVGESIDAVGDPTPPEKLTLPARADERRGFDSDEVRGLFSYAAHKGRAAQGYVSDRDESSPYSDALAEMLLRPDVRFRDVLNRIRTTVVMRTDKRQYPQVEDGGAAAAQFYMVNSAKTDQDARKAWDAAMSSNDPCDVLWFVQEHTSSRHAAAARRWLANHACRMTK